MRRTARTALHAAQATLVALMAVVLLACTAPAQQPMVTRAADPEGYRAGSSLPKPYTMPDTTLRDTSGQAFNLKTSPSRPVALLFFGYVNCPDVCRGVLADFEFAMQGLEPGVRNRIQMMMVTTDPARDDGPALRKYLDGFNPELIGLTGDLDTIKAAGGQVGVDITGKEKLPNGGYKVGHSTQVIGFDDDRRGVVLWTQGVTIGDLQHDLALLVQRSER